jgi:hypothetical protein
MAGAVLQLMASTELAMLGKAFALQRLVGAGLVVRG